MRDVSGPNSVAQSLANEIYLDVNVSARAFRVMPPKKGLPSFRLDLGSAAVNEQFDTRDETGVIRSQKQHHIGTSSGFPYSLGSDVPRARGLLYGYKELVGVFIPTARDIGRPPATIVCPRAITSFS